MRRLLPALLVLAACATPPPPPPAQDGERVAIEVGLQKAARFLLSKQAPDGAFRSETYSAFADGRALTPVVMFTLLYAAKVEGLDAAFAKAADFVATLVKKDGTIDEGPYGLDYPVYTLSMSIIALSVPINTRHFAARDHMMQALAARQLAEPLGWKPGDTSYGGWGYYRGLPKKPATGAVDGLLSSNLTSTMFASGALQMGGMSLDDDVLVRAKGFVLRCQNWAEPPSATDDGGFIHTPADAVPNKAGAVAGRDDRFRSYGTTTSDGLRAMLRLGVSRSDPHAQAASRWLLERFDPKRTPGEYTPENEVFRDSGWHYWTWTIAHALMFLGPAALEHPRTKDWPRALAHALLERQRPDGSWLNSATDQREDDPIIATSLAASALAITNIMVSDRFETAVTSAP